MEREEIPFKAWPKIPRVNGLYFPQTDTLQKATFAMPEGKWKAAA